MNLPGREIEGGFKVGEVGFTVGDGWCEFTLTTA
jgi:hypothetical protein